MDLIDISKQRFGRLVAISHVSTRKGRALWQCECDCGNTKVVSGKSLRGGNTRSCGCLSREWSAYMGSKRDFVAKRAAKNVTHGHKRQGARTVEYTTWLALKRRCYDQKDKDFPNWGGRGIKVCERWRTVFENFLADMGKRPEGPYSIDRIDPNGDYAPENCRWATISQQGSEHVRSHRSVTAFGRTFTNLLAAAREYRIGYTTLLYRIDAGWSPETALTTPLRSKRAVIPRAA